MITQEIAPHIRPKERWETGYGYGRGYGTGYPPVQQRVFAPFGGQVVIPAKPQSNIDSGNDRPHPHRMTKLEFDLYVGNLPIKKGDFVASKYANKPYKAHSVYRVTYIDEIHKFVQDWATPEIGPIILHLQSVQPHARITKGGANMHVTVLWDDLPIEWQQKLAREVKGDFTE